MVWPAIWAAALATVALAGDVIRQAQAEKATSPAWRKVD
jgi:hypothetical protein